jgi:hypothetical protein
MPHCAESIFLLDNAKLEILFYCHGAGKITYDRFFIDCYFNGFYKGRKHFVLTPRYAKNSGVVLKSFICDT